MSTTEKNTLVSTPSSVTELEASSVRIVRVELPFALVQNAHRSAVRYGVSAISCLVGSWALVLSRWIGVDVVVLTKRRSEPVLEKLNSDVEGNESAERNLSVNETIGNFMKRVASAVDEIAEQRLSELAQRTEDTRGLETTINVVCDLGGKGAQLALATLDTDTFGASAADASSKLVEIDVANHQGVLAASASYRMDKYANEVEIALKSWEEMLKHLPEDADVSADRLRWTSAIQRGTILTKFAGNPARSTIDSLIHERFEEQARRSVQRIAVSSDGQMLTYGELNTRANQVARLLQGLGVGPDARVALYVHRGLDMIIGIVGVLKAGAAYVPIDPGHPTERVQFIISDSMPAVVLTQQSLRKNIPECSPKVVELDRDRAHIDSYSVTDLDSRKQRSMHLAYVIYTSGSTGAPKGVMVEHHSVLSFIEAANERCQFTASDVWTLFHSIAFDFSVLELWGALLYGGQLVIVPYELTRAPADFYSLVCSSGVSVLNQTPSAFQQFIGAQAASQQSHQLRALILGGEALDLGSVRSWDELNAERRTMLFNMYGPTEATVFVTHERVTPSDLASNISRISIGTPLENSRIYILDKYGEPVPIGAVGEIYIGGHGVARGYVNRAALTAERFLPDRFSLESCARMYKTGDLGLWRSDGSIEYIGRNDDQVKIRGFRIELGEIQAQLLRHAKILQAHVIAREDVPGERRLVAYLIFRDLEGVSTENLRKHLRRALPEYMVPAAFVALEKFPLTRNGKLDRRTLPEPEFVDTNSAARGYEPPSGGVETALADIWREVLRVRRVARSDNFFELGGHSLLIVQLMERLRAIGLFIEVRRAFSSVSLADMARSITAAPVGTPIPPNRIPAKCTAISPDMLPLVALDERQIERVISVIPGGVANVQDIYPLLPLQEGMLFHHLYDGSSADIYVMPTVLSISSLERLKQLTIALQCVIDRHDVLRTAVVWQDLERPVQVVCRRAALPVEVANLDRGGDELEQINDWIRSASTQVPLCMAPLLRLCVFHSSGSEQCYAVLHLHHLVDDAVSSARLISEVAAHINGEGDSLPPPAAYRNHVAEVLALARTSNAAEFFRKKLYGIGEPTAPFRSLRGQADTSSLEEAQEFVSLELCLRLRNVARRLNVTVATLFHAAWGLVLARAACREDVVFGTVLLGRMRGISGAQPVLGMFVNTLPLRVRLENQNAREFVEQVQRELVDLMDYEHASLAEVLRCAGVAGTGPLFNSVLNFRHARAHPRSVRYIADGIRVLGTHYRTNYPITVSVDDTETEFVLTVQTVYSIKPQPLASYLIEATSMLIEALESDSQVPMRELRVIPSGDCRSSADQPPSGNAHDPVSEGADTRSASSMLTADSTDEEPNTVPPQTDLQRSVAAIWMRVLEVSSISIDDDFFELGGHSLLAMQVAVRLQSSLSIELPTRLIFEFPTVRGLVAQIEVLLQKHVDQAVRLDEMPDDLLQRVSGMSEREVQAMIGKLSNR